MQYRTRKIVKSEDLNGSQTLFGGRALAWIDEEAAIFAFCQLKARNLVTKAMSTIDFKAPARLGDIVEIGCSVVKFGRTSITVSCVMKNKLTQKEIVSIDAITFVNINEAGEPIPHGITQVSE
jgi:acyl-CoA thioesterase YciA